MTEIIGKEVERVPRKLFNRLILAFILQACLAGAVPAQELARGVVNEKVLCAGDEAQSYALYLPSSYSDEKKFPVLYCFDPMARGRVPVERFKAAAEKYGWIIAASNNSRNGPLKPSLAAASAVFEDTHRRFSIDEKRIYAAGFSGGARLALSLASSCKGCIAGVIACGAGFPPDIKPSASTPFTLFSTVGTEDFNFPELLMLESVLDKLSIPSRVEFFDGAHDWASAELSTKAVGWMELQALKSGRRKTDAAFLDSLWEEESRQARELEQSGSSFEAYRAYCALALDYEGLRDIAAVRERVKQLEGAKEIKRAVKEREEEVRQQRELTTELLRSLQARKEIENRVEAGASFGAAIKTLKGKSRRAKDGTERRVARRTLNGMFVLVIEEGMRYRDAPRDYSNSVFHLEVAAEIEPDNPYVLFHLACAYALGGEKRKGLQALTLAVEKGFDDRPQITGNKSLASLREEAEYKKLVERLGK
jgi:predicted esterase